ncbi:MAG TPA: Crp/Fnr family transcriptional regulator [Intrasporangium sp.]|uniref:Crp/Fnr family transcriptional regulator n=1 Tax=Intrasporangium sp. TaxID=1925024 RepID=UPI002B4704D7|nr:Crp/Fnr family transcriptional regulator [Intrasporangium sp.]HKX67777.1 Crp/Fnr family transcriptional regulator [Intrasporangium sp.]
MRWQLLQELTDEERRAVLSRARRQLFARGEILFHEGDPADTVHFVAEGRVMARRTTASGDSVAFRVIGPGRVLGDVAVVSADPRRSSTIVALEPTTTLVLSFAEFRALCAEHPGVQLLLATLLAARVKRLSNHLLEALFVPSDQRVVRRLLDLCEQYGNDGSGQVLIPLTQTDLAELAGATRPTVNRVLRALAAQGFVQLSRGRIVVVDPTRLAGRHAGTGL